MASPNNIDYQTLKQLPPKQRPCWIDGAICSTEKCQNLLNDGPGTFSVCPYCKNGARFSTCGCGRCRDCSRPIIASLASRLVGEYDVVIYVSPEGVDIEDNGVRTIDAKYRDSIDKAIKLMLNEWPPVKLIEIKGTTEERIETIKGALFS